MGRRFMYTTRALAFIVHECSKIDPAVSVDNIDMWLKFCNMLRIDETTNISVIDR
jgi:hypothetical protein